MVTAVIGRLIYEGSAPHYCDNCEAMVGMVCRLGSKGATVTCGVCGAWWFRKGTPSELLGIDTGDWKAGA